MANKIVLKKSSVAAKVPLSTDLEVGEIAVNLVDQKLYSKKADGTVVLVGTGGGGSGDVTGAASSTDNAIVRFDGTTGKAIQNSTVTIDDNGNANNVNAVSFDTTPATLPTTEGSMYWDADKGAVAFIMQGGDVVQEIGESQYLYIQASASITKGQVVMFTGAIGGSGIPTGAPATGVTDGTYIMGIAAEDITSGTSGFVQTFGILKPINTTGFATGTIIWYDPTVTGGFTTTKPVAPNIKVQLAAVTAGNSSGGAILIRVTAGTELGGTDSNAQITTPTNGQLITYDGTGGYWKNTELTAGTAINVSKSSAGVLTVANTAPDQVVSITGGGTTTVTGTYPNFTVSSDDQFDGTVTSVGGTGTVNGITLTGTVTSSGNLTLGGTLSGVDLATQVTGTLPAANGGTGLTAPGTSGNVLTSNGTTWTSAPAAGGGIDVYSYANRGQLRTVIGSVGDFVYVDTIGTFNWETASTDLDDDETCFDSTGGKWVLATVHSDYVNANFNAPWEPLWASAPITILSVQGRGSATQNVTVVGANVGDTVVISPAALPIGNELLYWGAVFVANVVTITVENPVVSVNTVVPSGNWSIAVISQ